jgi:magnesium transporter
MPMDTSDPRDRARLTPTELAGRLERLPDPEASEEFERLPIEEQAAVMLELDAEKAVQLLQRTGVPAAAALVSHLPPNVSADLLAQAPLARRTEVLAALPADLAAAVTRLLKYAPDSAGGIMDDRFIAVGIDETVAEVLARIQRSPERAEEITYIYAVDTAQRLVGVVALRNLLFSPPDRCVRDIMNPDVRFLRATDDQEEIARRIQHERFLALPVIDETDRLVGVVKLRDAIRVAQSEATEDMHLMVGLSTEERIYTPWNQSIGKRLPWLCRTWAPPCSPRWWWHFLNRPFPAGPPWSCSCR